MSPRPPNIPASVPRLNTQPVPPTPLTSSQQVTSAPPNQSEFSNHKIFDDQPNVESPFDPEYQFAPIPSEVFAQNQNKQYSIRSEAQQPLTASSGAGTEFPPLSAGYPESPSPRSVLLSPSKTSPTSRPLSPDLPTRDALYLFSNFSSYMRSPNEGSEGVRPDDFKDTIRLLEHARWLSSQPHSNVHILHLKYRFQGQSLNLNFRSPYTTGDYQLPLNYKDSIGRVRNPVPQPFSVLHDPVVKIDYMENGVFDPLPAQAVFSHIAKMCQPPPRIIVISYVFSRVIENHLSSLSTWALTSSPPAYIFSPLETRLREPQPLHVALGNSIPISMYAWPNELYSSNTSNRPAKLNLSPVPSSSSPPSSSKSTFQPAFNLNPLSPIKSTSNSNTNPVSSASETIPEPPLSSSSTTMMTKKQKFQENRLKIEDNAVQEDIHSPILITRRISASDSPDDIIDRYYARRTSVLLPQSNPSKLKTRYKNNDPIASLTVITSSRPSPAPVNLKALHKSKSNIDLSSANNVNNNNQNSIPYNNNDIRRGSASGLGLGLGPVMPPPIDRIPLWHLAPGVGILHGSTSASIGIKLSDFSAINLVGENGKIDSEDAKKEVSKSEVEEMGIKTSPINLEEDVNHNPNLTTAMMVLEKENSNLSDSITISRPSSTTSLPLPVGIIPNKQQQQPLSQSPLGSLDNNHKETKLTHLTPPDPNVLAKQKMANPATSPSWPAPISRVPGWRKGRKELMEDTLDELGLGFDGDLGQDEASTHEAVRGIEDLDLRHREVVEVEEGQRAYKELIDFLTVRPTAD